MKRPEEKTPITAEKACELVSRLYNSMLPLYDNPDSEKSRHNLALLCLRIVLCCYIQDDGAIVRLDSHYRLQKLRGRNLSDTLEEMFPVIDKREGRRNPYLRRDLAELPHFTNKLFKKKIKIPPIPNDIEIFITETMPDAADWKALTSPMVEKMFSPILDREIYEDFFWDPYFTSFESSRNDERYVYSDLYLELKKKVENGQKLTLLEEKGLIPDNLIADLILGKRSSALLSELPPFIIIKSPHPMCRPVHINAENFEWPLRIAEVRKMLESPDFAERQKYVLLVPVSLGRYRTEGAMLPITEHRKGACGITQDARIVFNEVCIADASMEIKAESVLGELDNAWEYMSMRFIWRILANLRENTTRFYRGVESGHNTRGAAAYMVLYPKCYNAIFTDYEDDPCPDGIWRKLIKTEEEG